MMSKTTSKSPKITPEILTMQVYATPEDSTINTPGTSDKL
jgi:hypothetical protein